MYIKTTPSLEKHEPIGDFNIDNVNMHNRRHTEAHQETEYHPYRLRRL